MLGGVHQPHKMGVSEVAVGRETKGRGREREKACTQREKRREGFIRCKHYIGKSSERGSPSAGKFGVEDSVCPVTGRD